VQDFIANAQEIITALSCQQVWRPSGGRMAAGNAELSGWEHK
jgi:hypothetical protein